MTPAFLRSSRRAISARRTSISFRRASAASFLTAEPRVRGTVPNFLHSRCCPAHWCHFRPATPLCGPSRLSALRLLVRFGFMRFDSAEDGFQYCGIGRLPDRQSVLSPEPETLLTVQVRHYLILPLRLWVRH